MGSHLGPGWGRTWWCTPILTHPALVFYLSANSNLGIPRVLPVTAAGKAIAASGRRGQGRRSRRSGPLSPPAAGCYPSGRCGDGKGDPTHPLLNASRIEHLSIPEPGRGSGGGAPAGSGAAPRHASPSHPGDPKPRAGDGSCERAAATHGATSGSTETASTAARELGEHPIHTIPTATIAPKQPRRSCFVASRANNTAAVR